MSSAAAVHASEAPLFGPEHEDYRESFRTFLAREVKPAYPDWRRDRGIPTQVIHHAGAQGYLGMSVPEEHGGLGVDDPRFGAIVAEEAMLAGFPALALVLASHSDVALPALQRGAPDEWKRRQLPALATGETLATIVRGPVTRKGDSLSGEAQMVAGGTCASVFVVHASGGDGDSLLLVERDGDGVDVRPSEPSIGLEAAGLATVRFDDVPAIRLDADPESLEADHALALAISALAGAGAALRITVEYVRERRAFGVPIADFQNTRRVLADVTAGIEVATAHVERALRARIDGSLDSRAAQVAKLFCTELGGRAADTGLQLHGGYGYMMEYEIAHAFADARYWRLAGTTNQRTRDAIGDSLFA